MLTIEDKERIKAEEIYREEVRKQLSENEKSSSSKEAWKFINSSFGVWLLSTVVVGLIVYLYNDNKLQNEISANSAATIQKLETETSNRLQQFKSALSNQDPSKIYFYRKAELAYMIDGILVGDGTLAQRKPIYIFPEYKERTMNSLLYEIGRLTSEKEKVSTITEARIILTRIQDSLLNMEEPPSRDFSVGQIPQQKVQVGQPLTLDEQKQLAEYKLKEESFKQGPLSAYYTRIKNDLNSLLALFQNNAFLKEMSNK